MKDWLNSPDLKALREAWCEAEKRQKAEDDAWWDSLDYDGKSQAFRQIVKLMYKAEVIERGSYRHALYEVFGLEYGDGLGAQIVGNQNLGFSHGERFQS